MNTDILIIGSGPGGYETAAYAARLGREVTVVEERLAGGTCLNCGCIPTKSLVHDARLAVAATDKAARFAAAMARKDSVVETLRQGVEGLLQQPGIRLVRGHARFVADRTVCVGPEHIEARHVIIATGSEARMPPVPGLGAGERSPRVVTSEQLLSRQGLPASLCIIGAGVIGLEMASVFAAFGCEVTVVEYLKECLPTMDGELARRLRKALDKQGIRFCMGAAVQRVEGDNVVWLDAKKQTEVRLRADAILVATGRRPRTEGLGLECTAIGVTPVGITTDDNLQTTVPGIYAVGDVNGRQMLAHAATFQGMRAVNHIMGRRDAIRLDVMPAAVFTQPEAAAVGLTEEACKEAGLDYACHKAIYRANGRAQATEQTDGLAKIICDADDRIIGCHVLGADAAALVQEVAALMSLGITRQRLADIVHIHPTLNEILLDAARH